MKRATSLLILVVALSGCGSGSSPVATERSLVNSIPTATELPPGWADQGANPITDLEPQTGDGFGFCGGPNGDQRAISANVIAHVYQAGWQTAVDGQFGDLALYAFASEEDAAAFMASTQSAVSSCTTEEFEAPEFVEGRDDNTTDYRLDNFREDFEPDGPWELVVQNALGAAAAEGADEAFHTRRTFEDRAYTSSKAYGKNFARVSQHERYGTVVAIFSIYGECCWYGFSNSELADDDTLPEYKAVQAAADHFRPRILAEVFNNTDA